MLLDKKGYIKRLSEYSTDKERYEVDAGLTNIPLHIQPASNETVAITNGVAGKTYTVFTTRSGVRDGDRITVSGLFVDGVSQNKELSVQSIGNWSFPPLAHFEMVCVEVEE